MTAPVLNTVGLLLTILGCWLLYRFGLPAGVLVEDESADRMRHWGRKGFILIMVGSLLQIVGTWWL